MNNQRFGLSSLSQDIGLGGQRERDENGESDSGADRSRTKKVLSEPPAEPGQALAAAKEEEAVTQPLTERSNDLAQARLLAAEQRKAAESLLLEARALEKQLLDESAHAQEARERSGELAAIVNRAIAAEQEARERARLASERHGLITAERRQIETVLLASRRATEAATSEIAELKRRLEDVLKIATDASNLLHAQEQRAGEAATAVASAEKELSEANSLLAKRQVERENAERDARAAKDRADAAAKRQAIPEQSPPAGSSTQASSNNGKQKTGAGAS